MLQWLHTPHWLCHQRRFANCDWMLASYTNRQPSHPRWHPTCWASSHWSHTVFSTPCHGATDICSTQRSPIHRVQMQGASNRDTHLYPLHNNSSVYLITTTYVRRSGHTCGALATILTFTGCNLTKVSTAFEISRFEAVVSNIDRFPTRSLPCTSLVFWYRDFVSHWPFAPVFMLCFVKLHRCWRQ